MEISGKQRFLWISGVLVLLILVRVGMIWHSNREAEKPAPPPSRQPVSLDAYVAPPKLHAYDLASAKQGLEGKTIWVMAGGQLPYFAARGSSVDWKHEVGTLLPLDALHVIKVVKAPPAVELIKQGNVTFHKEGQPKIAAIFTHGSDQKNYAVEIGTADHDSYSFTVDDAFYLEDPHILYKHWPQQVWKAIDDHRAEKGMNELQTSLALGPGRADSDSKYGNRTMEYTRNGENVSVTFENDKAISVSE